MVNYLYISLYKTTEMYLIEGQLRIIPYQNSERHTALFHRASWWEPHMHVAFIYVLLVSKTFIYLIVIGFIHLSLEPKTSTCLMAQAIVFFFTVSLCSGFFAERCFCFDSQSSLNIWSCVCALSPPLYSHTRAQKLQKIPAVCVPLGKNILISMVSGWVKENRSRLKLFVWE